MSTGLTFLLVIVGFILLSGIFIYNSLVSKKNQVENVFAGIDAILKKRYDLIPNLVSAVQQYMKHESGTLTEITRLRAEALKGNLSDDQKVELNNQISRALGSINIAVENYPDLKASNNFMQLQGSMNEIEEQLSAARRAFNSAVTIYNNAVEMFPTNIYAMILGYRRKQVFEISVLERENPDLNSLFNR